MRERQLTTLYASLFCAAEQSLALLAAIAFAGVSIDHRR
jgi:hypothetical protein